MIPIQHNDRKLNCLRWRPNESYSHVKMKLEVAYYLRSQGLSFYSECTFTSPHSGRADLVAVTGNSFIIIEILETEEVLTPSKRKTYPDVEIICVRANQQFRPELIQ